MRNIPDESHAYFSSYVQVYLYKYTDDVHVSIKKSQPQTQKHTVNICCSAISAALILLPFDGFSWKGLGFNEDMAAQKGFLILKYIKEISLQSLY